MEILYYLTKGIEDQFNRVYIRTIKSIDERHFSVAKHYHHQLEGILNDMEIANEPGCKIDLKFYNEKEQSIKLSLEEI